LVLLMSGYGALEVGVPIFITVINGFSVSWVGVSFAVNTFTIVAAQLLVLRLIAGRSRSYLVLAVAVIWGLSWILTGASLLAAPAVALAMVLAASGIFALGETLWAPVAPSLVNDLAPEHLRGRYNSSMSLVWSLSSIIGPGIAGLMLGAGLTVEWIVVLVAGCAAAAVMAVRLRGVLSAQLDGRVPA
ncbi:MAG: MFS transporter, partial [Actinobacteria bacterium]|nr:MFS transporter [Actinomycetota bacterium]